MTRDAPPVVVAGFTAEQASILTNVSLRQLSYWTRDGFFVPSLDLLEVSGTAGRLYSFRDLVCLRVVSALRNEANVSLQHLREVKTKLAHLGDDLWAKTTLYVLNRRVVFSNPTTKVKEEIVSGQGVLQIPLAVVSGDMEAAVRALRSRKDDDIGQIDAARGRAKNPVVAGTRIPVRVIKDFAAAGYTVAQIRSEYPSLTDADVEAAIAHSQAA